jgi:hypothetical protein
MKDGKIDNPAMVKRAFNLPDGWYEFEPKRKNRRSNLQNAYYWGVVVAMVHEGLRDMGNDVSLMETHEYLKARFNTKEIVNTIVGEVTEVPMSTTDLNKEDFAAYIEKIQQFAAEYLNINIPSPGQQVAFEL